MCEDYCIPPITRIVLVWLFPELNLCYHPISNVTALQTNNDYARNVCDCVLMCVCITEVAAKVMH